MRIITDLHCTFASNIKLKEYAIKNNMNLSLEEIEQITTVLCLNSEIDCDKMSQKELLENKDEVFTGLVISFKEDSENLLSYLKEMKGLSNDDRNNIIDAIIKLADSATILNTLSIDKLTDYQKDVLVKALCTNAYYFELKLYYVENCISKENERLMVQSLEKYGHINDIIEFLYVSKNDDLKESLINVVLKRDVLEQLAFLVQTHNHLDEKYKSIFINNVIENGDADDLRYLINEIQKLSEKEIEKATQNYLNKVDDIDQIIIYVDKIEHQTHFTKKILRDILTHISDLSFKDIYDFITLFNHLLNKEDYDLIREKVISKKDENKKLFILYTLYNDNDIIPIVYGSYENLYKELRKCEDFIEEEIIEHEEYMISPKKLVCENDGE